METLERKRRRTKRIIAILKRLFPKSKTVLRHRNVWELLVATVLSAQTTDKKVNEVTEALFRKYPTVRAYAAAKPKRFTADIKGVNFYRTKAKNVVAAAKLIRKNFGGKVPQTMEELIMLPGVARKTANIVLWEGYEKNEGIAVDTHVMRLSRILGLTKEFDPVKIERDLVEIVPRKDWGLFNSMLVDYGRKYCPARPHEHARCPLRRLEI